jgi:hypothetical protein
MLAWTPGADSVNIVPLSDSHSLVRLLGGGSSAKGSPPGGGNSAAGGGKRPSSDGDAEGKHRGDDGDVVMRDADTGALETVWDLLWSRLDPWVNTSGIAHPILVLDNVPYAFCDKTKCNENGSLFPGAKYGMVYGPANVTEYAEWIEVLLRGMAARYGNERAASFWFRVATEPNTRPGHWNDTNSKYIEEYVAVAGAVGRALPLAKVGLANMGADGSQASWDNDVMPIAKGVAASGARVDFIAMSCYGRGKPLHASRYSIGTASLCGERLDAMRALGSTRWADLPAQSMEYGLQENFLNIRDEERGCLRRVSSTPSMESSARSFGTTGTWRSRTTMALAAKRSA